MPGLESYLSARERSRLPRLCTVRHHSHSPPRYTASTPPHTASPSPPGNPPFISPFGPPRPSSPPYSSGALTDGDASPPPFRLPLPASPPPLRLPPPASPGLTAPPSPDRWSGAPPPDRWRPLLDEIPTAEPSPLGSPALSGGPLVRYRTPPPPYVRSPMPWLPPENEYHHHAEENAIDDGEAGVDARSLRSVDYGPRGPPPAARIRRALERAAAQQARGGPVARMQAWRWPTVRGRGSGRGWSSAPTPRDPHADDEELRLCRAPRRDQREWAEHIENADEIERVEEVDAVGRRGSVVERVAGAVGWRRLAERKRRTPPLPTWEEVERAGAGCVHRRSESWGDMVRRKVLRRES